MCSTFDRVHPSDSTSSDQTAQGEEVGLYANKREAGGSSDNDGSICHRIVQARIQLSTNSTVSEMAMIKLLIVFKTSLLTRTNF